MLNYGYLRDWFQATILTSLATDWAMLDIVYSLVGSKYTPIDTGGHHAC